GSNPLTTIVPNRWRSGNRKSRRFADCSNMPTRIHPLRTALKLHFAIASSRVRQNAGSTANTPPAFSRTRPQALSPPAAAMWYHPPLTGRPHAHSSFRGEHMNRRAFLKWGAGAALTAPALGLGYGLFEAGWFRVARVTVPVPNLPNAFSGLTVALLTDLHHGRY